MNYKKDTLIQKQDLVEIANQNFRMYCKKTGLTDADISNAPSLSLRESIAFSNNEILKIETIETLSINFGFPKDFFYSEDFLLPITLNDILESTSSFGNTITKSDSLFLYLNRIVTAISKHPALINPPSKPTPEEKFLVDNHLYTNEALLIDTINNLNKTLHKLNACKEKQL